MKNTIAYRLGSAACTIIVVAYSMFGCPQAAAPGTQPPVSSMATAFNQAAQNQLGSNGPTLPTMYKGYPTATRVSGSVPCIIAKSVGYIESSWTQFKNGSTLISSDCGYGVMQITSGMQGGAGFDPARVASDYTYNIGTGVKILIDKWNATPSMGNNDPQVPEDWYFAVWAYNGFSYVNNPNNPKFSVNRQPYDGSQPRGNYPYQELVWGRAANSPGSDYWSSIALTLPSRSSIPNSSTVSGHFPEPSPTHGTGCQTSMQKVSTPAINPGSGSYIGSVPVSITTATSNATIRYTTTGADPTSTSPVYSGPITVTTNLTIKAKAFKSGMIDSDIASASYAVVQKVSAPSFSPASGSFNGPVQVTIASATAGATIRYSTNGTDPTSTSAIYSGPLTFSSSTTVKAKAFRSGMTDSDVTAASYQIVIPILAWEFNSTGNTQGWTPANYSAFSVNSGILFIDPSGIDPYVAGPSISVSASSYRYVQLRMASNAADANGAIYFRTQAENFYSETKKVTFYVSYCRFCGNAAFVSYSIYMPQNAKWTGTITGIRLDPADSGKAGSNVDSIGIDYIRLSP